MPITSDRTRLTIDFRTASLDDLLEGAGAPNADSECSGTNRGDFVRVSDRAPLPDEVIEAATARKRPLAGWRSPGAVSRS